MQEVLPILTQAWGKNLEPGAAAATFLTLPVDDCNFGEEASVDRKGAAAHTDGVKAHDLMFGVSADDTRGGGLLESDTQHRKLGRRLQANSRPQVNYFATWEEAVALFGENINNTVN